MQVYRNARLIDGTGRPAVEQAALVTDKSKIVYAGPESDLPAQVSTADSEQIDLGGRTLLPGLFNCHVHLALRFPFSSYVVDEYRSPAYRAMVCFRRAAEALACGVTTIRGVGDADWSDLAVRDAIDKNMFLGSRVIASGPIVIAHGGHGANGWGSVECSGPYEFLRAARTLLFHGVDLIKICVTGGMNGEHEGAADTQMTAEEIRAVTSAADNAGKLVAAHLGHDAAIRLAVENGVRSVEHAYIMNRETAELLAEKGAWLVPTLAVSHALDYLEAHHNPRYHIEKIRQIGRQHQQSAQNAVAAGVRLCVGTDLLPSDPIDGTNATVREVELLTEAGLSNLEALRAATSNSAELCGVADITGTLTAGKEADFIAVDGKPDLCISDLRKLALVAKGGTVVRSSVPGLSGTGFPLLPFGQLPEGASFIDW